MARIDEEQILVRLSKLIRDEDDPLAGDIVTEDLRLSIEEYVQTIVDTDVLVEANIASGGESGIPYSGTETAASFRFSVASASVVEGAPITVNLIADAGVAADTVVPFTVTGMSSAELSGAGLTGSFTVTGGSSDSVTFTTVDSNGASGTRIFTLSLDDDPAIAVSVTVTPSA